MQFIFFFYFLVVRPKQVLHSAWENWNPIQEIIISDNRATGRWYFCERCIAKSIIVHRTLRLRIFPLQQLHYLSTLILCNSTLRFDLKDTKLEWACSCVQVFDFFLMFILRFCHMSIVPCFFQFFLLCRSFNTFCTMRITVTCFPCIFPHTYSTSEPPVAFRKNLTINHKI